MVTGNLAKRKLNDKEPTPAKGSLCPQLILPTGVRQWGSALTSDGMGVLTVADTLALERFCDIYADILQLRGHHRCRGQNLYRPDRGWFLAKANLAVFNAG